MNTVQPMTYLSTSRSTSVLVLGATGSIGRQTLDCLRAAKLATPGRFSLAGMSAHRSGQALAELSREWPEAKTMLTSTAADAELAHFIRDIEADLVVNGISGASGLRASVATLAAGKNLALANKESVVMGWDLLSDLARRKNCAIIPVDSEHAALFQLFRRIGAASVQEVCITASGGPFRDWKPEHLARVRPDEAARHPTWKMGRKISIDSATLANKGLEVIEAVRLFDMPVSKVRVLIHPESLAHALVRTIDGALYAHLSQADMRLPIDTALRWPEDAPCPFGHLDLAGKTLSFRDPDPELYPMLALARRAIEQGKGATIAYNAANEVAVAAFEAGRIGFTGIARLVAQTLAQDWISPEPVLDAILECDARVRSAAQALV